MYLACNISFLWGVVYTMVSWRYIPDGENGYRFEEDVIWKARQDRQHLGGGWGGLWVVWLWLVLVLLRC